MIPRTSLETPQVWISKIANYLYFLSLVVISIDDLMKQENSSETSENTESSNEKSETPETSHIDNSENFLGNIPSMML